MKKAILVLVLMCCTGLMVSCKSGHSNENTTDTLQTVVFPENAPNLKYLQIFDSLDSFGWFEMDTLWLTYDDDYKFAPKPRYINGVPVVWLSSEENTIPTRHYIEYGYETHGDTVIYVCVYDVHYTEDFEPDGATHSFYPKVFLDSILNPKQTIQEQPEEMIFEFDESKVKQRRTDAAKEAWKAGHRAGEMKK